MKRLAIPLLSILSIPALASSQDEMKLYNTGWNQIYAKKYKLANESFTKSLGQLPSDKKWLAIDGQGWSAYYLGDYKKARKIFLNNIESNPKASYSYKGLSFVYIKMKKWDEAHNEFMRAVSMAPKQPLHDYLFAYNSFMNSNHYKYAIDVLSKALTVYPKSADVNFYLAKALLASGDKNKAYLLLSTATYYAPVKISPLFNKLKGIDLEMAQDSLLNMGWGLYVANYFKDSLYRFDQCLEQNKNNVNALRGKGFSLLRLKEYQKANDILEYALQSPGHDKLQPVKTLFTDKNKNSVSVIIDTETMIGWAKYYLGEYLTAKDIFSQVVENHPDWINARLGLAYTQKALGENYQSTVASINKEAPGYSTHIPELSSHILTKAYKKYNLAWKEIFDKNYDAATKNIEAAKKDFPKSLKWLADDARAWIEYYKGNYSKARQDFEAIIKSTPHAALSYKGLSYCFIYDRNYKMAYNKAIAMIRINPMQSLDTYNFLVNNFISGKQYQYASEILKTALYYYPSSGDLLLSKARMLWESGDTNAAYQAIEVASFYSPIQTKAELSKFKGLDQAKLGHSILNVAWGLYANRDYAKALEVFNKYYENNEHNMDLATLNALRGQGFCLLQLKQFSKAANKIETLLKYKDSSLLKPVSSTFYSTYGVSIPIYIDAETTLAWAYYSLGKYRKSENAFQKVLDKNPTWVNARLGLAYVMRASGNKRYKEEIKVVNKHAPGYGAFVPELPVNISKKSYDKYNKAWAEVFSGNYDEAIKMFKDSKTNMISKDKWIADDGVAWVSFYKKEYNQAINQFSKIVAQNPQASLSYKGMAYSYLKLKNYGKAFDNVQKLMKVAPKQELDVYSYLSYSFLEASQLHFAKETIIKGLSIYPTSGVLKFYRAQLLWAAGQKEESYRLIIEAAKESPLAVAHGIKSMKGLKLSKIQPALVDIGWGLYGIYKNDEAMDMFTHYYDSANHDGALSLKTLDAMRGIGLCYIRLKDYHKAERMLEDVLSHPKADALEPIVTYYYPPNKDPIKVYTDARTGLGWAQLSLGEFRESDSNFSRVLDEHPGWINARLGKAYVLELTDREDLSDVYVDMINKLAPGYGVIDIPSVINPWTVIIKSTAAWYKPDSSKNNSQAYQLDVIYEPIPELVIGGFYNYQHINFRPPAASLVPSKQDRAGYSFSILKEIENFGWIGPSGKGNYIFSSSYEDKGANNTFFPYWAITYKTPDRLTTLELGYAKVKFKDIIGSENNQVTITAKSKITDEWTVGATIYRANAKSMFTAKEKLTAAVLTANYYFNEDHNVSTSLLLGRRKHAYGLDLNKVYDIRDKQKGSFGVSYQYKVKPNIGIMADVSYDKFILSTNSNKSYRAYYVTLGLIVQ